MKPLLRIEGLCIPVITFLLCCMPSPDVRAQSPAVHAGRESTDWPSYNRTLASGRFAPVRQINRSNVQRLRVVCSYDTGLKNSFQTGLIQADGALFFATEHETWSINPDTCKENWKIHEDFPGSTLHVSRGVAVLDGTLFRGNSDGTVRAYDARTGKPKWSTAIADPKAGESLPAAPIAWNGLVFIGNAGGDNRGVKGRMYALDANTGRIVWEFYLVPKGPHDKTRGPQGKGAQKVLHGSWNNDKGFDITGGATWTSYTLDPANGLLYVPGGNPAPDFVNQYRQGRNLFTGSVVVLDARTGDYRRHYQLVLRDFHDWDVASAPVLFSSKAGKPMLAVAPKDGRLYGIDLADGRQAFKLPVTTIENENAPLTAQGVRFCPGSQGGAEWNGPAYDPDDGLLYVGEVDWCVTIATQGKDKLLSVAQAQPWSGTDDGFGKFDDFSRSAGWLTAVDPVAGKQRWQFKSPAPILGAVTPTAGGLVLFGDMVGNFYAFDANAGKQLWHRKLDGALGGGVISYDTGAGQKIAVATGMHSPIWPSPQVTGKVVVFGLGQQPDKQQQRLGAH